MYCSNGLCSLKTEKEYLRITNNIFNISPGSVSVGGIMPTQATIHFKIIVNINKVIVVFIVMFKLRLNCNANQKRGNVN